LSRSGRDRGTERDRSEGHRLALDLVATRTLESSRDTGPHPEPVVRGVRQGVHFNRSDVALANLEPKH
jgi:hypothetical protein